MKSVNISNIGKIIKSDSHINYKCRVYGVFESNEELNYTDFQFGQFVKLNAFNNIDIIGIIFNSCLYNPDYGNFGPRLSNPASNNAVFMPDFIEETAIILDIITVGWKENNIIKQGIPPWVIPLNTEVETITNNDINDFHIKNNEQLDFSYYNIILNNTGNISFQLLANIINTLENILDQQHQDKLNILKQHLQWQQTTLATKV